MRTPLYAAHAALGARFVSFAGWEMPVQYTGIMDEHRAVRERAGLFDVSHMGEIEVRGPEALAVCQQLTVNDVARLQDGQVQYSLLCLPTGGAVDDVTVYRLASDRYLFCVNASNTAKVFDWMRANAKGAAEVIDRSSEYAQIALQGPRATAILARCTAAHLDAVRAFWFVEAEVAGMAALVSRTGYTGEDGWEIYCPPQGATCIWSALLEAGAADGIAPAGLGARDTLRLERALALYGHELDEETTPLEAGLAWVVHLEKTFIGREALQRQRAAGLPRRLVGVALTEPGIPRQGYAIHSGGQRIGTITSGTMAPTLGKAIGLGYVTSAYAQVGARVEIEIRNRAVAATQVALPFYKRRA